MHFKSFEVFLVYAFFLPIPPPPSSCQMCTRLHKSVQESTIVNKHVQVCQEPHQRTLSTVARLDPETFSSMHLTVFRQGRTLLDQGCPNFDENFFGASVHEKIEI